MVSMFFVKTFAFEFSKCKEDVPVGHVCGTSTLLLSTWQSQNYATLAICVSHSSAIVGLGHHPTVRFFFKLVQKLVLEQPTSMTQLCVCLPTWCCVANFWRWCVLVGWGLTSLACVASARTLLWVAIWSKFKCFLHVVAFAFLPHCRCQCCRSIAARFDDEHDRCSRLFGNRVNCLERCFGIGGKCQHNPSRWVGHSAALSTMVAKSSDPSAGCSRNRTATSPAHFTRVFSAGNYVGEWRQALKLPDGDPGPRQTVKSTNRGADVNSYRSTG